MNDPQSLISLVDEATRRGINLSATADGSLGFRAPSGALTDELRAKLSAHRDALVDMISGPRFSAHGPRAQTPFLKYYATGLWKRIRSGDVGVIFTNGTRWVAQVDGPFSAAAFAASVDFVASRHDILNVTIRELDDVPTFRRERTVGVQLVELSTGTEAAGTPDLMRVVADIVWRPFDPEVDILFRPFVVRVSESCHVIGFVLNHLIGDGVSVGVLCRQLVRAYKSAISGNRLEISKPALQYSDYVLTMNAWLASPARDYRLAYWRRQLDGIAPCKLPVDHVIDAEQPIRTSTHCFTFSAEQFELVHRLARELSTTVYFVLVAAYARALSSETRQSSVALVSMYHGRDNLAIAETVGSMQNQLLLRIPAAQSGAFASLVRVAQRVQSEALEFQLPFDCICQDIPGAPPQTAYPELNFHLSGTGAGQASPTLENRSAHRELRRWMKPFEVPSPATVTCARAFPGIKLVLRAGDSGIRGFIIYLPSEYDTSTIARFAATLIESFETAEQQFAVG